MDAFADKRLALKAFNLKYQAATVHFDNLCFAADGCTHGAGFQVLDVDRDAHSSVAFADFVGDAFQAGFSMSAIMAGVANTSKAPEP